jgi:hypothetical protein
MKSCVPTGKGFSSLITICVSLLIAVTLIPADGIGGDGCESKLRATPGESICTVLSRSAEYWYQQNWFQLRKRHLAPPVQLNQHDVSVTGGWTFYVNCFTKGIHRIVASPFYRTVDDCTQSAEVVESCVETGQISVGETVLIDRNCIQETIRADMPSRLDADPVPGSILKH